MSDNSETAVSEERIAALEKKVQGMDAQVRRLLDDFLDFKGVAMTLSRQALQRGFSEPEEPVEQEAVAAPSITSPSEKITVIRSGSARQSDVPAEPAEPHMVRIMQADGTMKSEPRYGDKNTTSSSGGYGRDRKSTLGRGK